MSSPPRNSLSLSRVARTIRKAELPQRVQIRHAACNGCCSMGDLNTRLLEEIVDGVRDLLKKEQSERLRDVYLIGDIERDNARVVIERLRELANDSRKPVTLYINSAGGNVTDGLAIHDVLQHLVSMGIEITIVVQGMAYSMGSVILQAASPGRRVAYPHS